MICEKRYAELEEAEVCEGQHAALAPTGSLRLHLGNPCAFCEGDPCRCFSPPPPKVLTPQEVLRLGALTLQAESSEAVERLLEDQREVYLTSSKPALVDALLDRDRLLANQGRQIADGRTVSRIAREMVRAALYAAGGRPDALAVQRAIDSFGAGAPDPAGLVDARQLKLHGSTLGPLKDPAQVAEGLASGAVKEHPGSARVKDGALQEDRE